MRSRTRSQFARGLHPDRTLGGDRHHRRLDRAAVARRAVGPRGRPPRPVHQQPQADRLGSFNYESSNGAFPQRASQPTSPCERDDPASQFVDGGWSTLARILPYMEAGNSFNALNFNFVRI